MHCTFVVSMCHFQLSCFCFEFRKRIPPGRVLGPHGSGHRPEKWSEQLRCQSALGPLSWPATKNASQSCWFAPKDCSQYSPPDHFPVGGLNLWLVVRSTDSTVSFFAALELFCGQGFFMEAELLKNLTHLADFCRRPDVTLEELSCFSECRVKSYTRPLGITSPQSTLEKGKGGRIADRVIGSFVACEELRSWYRALSNGLQRCEGFQRQELRARWLLGL